METGSPDRRVRKTRQRLRQGLVKLMQTKNIQDITVTELCAECDINRSTFYLHYSDVYGLLKTIENELLEVFTRHLDELITILPGQQTHPGPEICGMFEMLAENADICRVLLCDNGDMAFVQQVKDLVRRRVLDGWGAMFCGGENGMYDYVNAFAVSGCLGMVQCWLEKDMPIAPREMAAMVEAALAGGIPALQ